jgi:hypothetical protein
MRWSVVFTCLALAGCSWSEALPPLIPSTPQTAAAFQAIVERAAAEAKLPLPIEVSPIRAAHPISPAEWMICLKSSAPDQSRRYAVFMRNNEMVAFRLGVLIDECDHQTYQPFVKTP